MATSKGRDTVPNEERTSSRGAHYFPTTAKTQIFFGASPPDGLIRYPRAMSDSKTKTPMAARFRGFLPVVVDVETAGFDPLHDALLEVAAVTLRIDEAGMLHRFETHAVHIEPFGGANLDPKALEFTGIDPYHPFRGALPEREGLTTLLKPIRAEVKAQGCNRAVMVAHNPIFDLAFFNAAVERAKIKRNPFHPFSGFDTGTLGGLFYGQTVLARIAEAAGISWDSKEAHSAIYDAERTADIFCLIHNRWERLRDDRPPD